VSKEKNLHLLADAFARLAAERRDVHLVVVGDGPYLAGMRRAMAGCPCYFTGFVEGPSLAAMYASADLFVFPSATDTFGNAVLEAQASGLPVIVTDKWGPCENMIPGKTGMVVRAGDADHLLQAIMALAGDPVRIREMGQAARKSMEARSFESAFLSTWNLYHEIQSQILGRAV
jgi:glycosyltransferase involved in cell wall biosynthesis